MVEHSLPIEPHPVLLYIGASGVSRGPAPCRPQLHQKLFSSRPFSHRHHSFSILSTVFFPNHLKTSLIDLFVHHITKVSSTVTAIMTSSDPDRDRHFANDEGPLNPFVAFRRFADAQMSSLVNNVFGIVQSSPIRRQQAIDDYESMLQETRQRKQNESDSQAQTDRQMEANREVMNSYIRAIMGREESDSRPTQSTHDDHNDDDDDDSGDILEEMRCPYLKPSDPMLPPPSIDIAYLWTSPYSPLALEREEILRQHSGTMRAAFADLMAMQNRHALISDNNVELHAQLTPASWATNMGRIMVGDGTWLDREKPRPLQLSGLLSALSKVAEQKSKEGREGSGVGDDSIDHDDDEELQRPSSAPISRLFEVITNAARDVLQDRDEQTALDEKADQMMYEAFLADTNEANEDDDSACMCCHCRNYERRKTEFSQWLKEEPEEATAGDDNEDGEGTQDPATELDQYHALADYQAYQLKHDQRRQQAESSASHKNPKTQTQTQLDTQPKSTTEPSLLSTLTTTVQRTLSDGTVTTKVVLKKRFSDGGEEVTEKLHTQQPTPLLPPPETSITNSHDRPPAESTNPNNTTDNDRQKKGWFWS